MASTPAHGPSTMAASTPPRRCPDGAKQDRKIHHLGRENAGAHHAHQRYHAISDLGAHLSGCPGAGPAGHHACAGAGAGVQKPVEKVHGGNSVAAMRGITPEASCQGGVRAALTPI